MSFLRVIASILGLHLTESTTEYFFTLIFIATNAYQNMFFHRFEEQTPVYNCNDNFQQCFHRCLNILHC